jgi:ubiquinone/menaquinone biosynthesis C-methylase UbiE
MGRTRIPARLAWAVQMLDVAPDDHILEVGCGSGVAVSLVCERLTGSGRILAIDRSGTAIKRATERNAAHVASGKASLEQIDLAELETGGMRFDKVFAVNVNLFWVRTATAELSVVKRLLRRGGRLYLCYEAPGAERAGRVAESVAGHLAEQGFAVTTAAGPTPSLVCVSARTAARR